MQTHSNGKKLWGEPVVLSSAPAAGTQTNKPVSATELTVGVDRLVTVNSGPNS